MAGISQRDQRTILTALTRQGWTFRRNKHLVLYPPDKKHPPVVMAISTHGGRGYENTLAMLRRAGAII